MDKYWLCCCDVKELHCVINMLFNIYHLRENVVFLSWNPACLISCIVEIQLSDTGNKNSKQKSQSTCDRWDSPDESETAVMTPQTTGWRSLTLSSLTRLHHSVNSVILWMLPGGDLVVADSDSSSCEAQLSSFNFSTITQVLTLTCWKLQRRWLWQQSSYVATVSLTLDKKQTLSYTELKIFHRRSNPVIIDPQPTCQIFIRTS